MKHGCDGLAVKFDFGVVAQEVFKSYLNASLYMLARRLVKQLSGCACVDVSGRD